MEKWPIEWVLSVIFIRWMLIYIALLLLGVHFHKHNRSLSLHYSLFMLSKWFLSSLIVAMAIAWSDTLISIFLCAIIQQNIRKWTNFPWNADQRKFAKGTCHSPFRVIFGNDLLSILKKHFTFQAAPCTVVRTTWIVAFNNIIIFGCFYRVTYIRSTYRGSLYSRSIDRSIMQV